VHLAAEQGQNSARYFTDWVLPQLDVLVPDNDQPIEVWTTLDPVAQRAATDAITAQVPKGAQGALVSVDRDGAVLAMVGGTDYVTSNYNRATNAVRQPGSAWKLFVYLAALERGYRPEDRVVDEPVTINGWSPRNSGGNYAGQIDVRTAFAYSKNTVAAQLGNEVGFDAVANMARRFGITTPINTMPSMVLGTSDVRVIDMVRAFASVEAKGKLVTPYGIRKVTTTDGEVLYSHRPDPQQQLVPDYVAAEITDLLQTAVNIGTGRAAQIGRPVAGKTGTTSSNKDGWFLGFSSGVTTGVWMGRDDAHPVPGFRAAPRRRAPLPPICGWPRPSARSNSSTTSSSCPNGNWSRTTRRCSTIPTTITTPTRTATRSTASRAMAWKAGRVAGRAGHRAARPTMPSPSTRMAWAPAPPLQPGRRRAMRRRRPATTCSTARPAVPASRRRGRSAWREAASQAASRSPGTGLAGLLTNPRQENAAGARTIRAPVRFWLTTGSPGAAADGVGNMGLFQWAAAAAAGYVIYRAVRTKNADGEAPAAFATGEAPGENFAKVRSAGVEGMRSDPPKWDKQDQAVDESFPASDPPATY
jgi:membrane peptidoglycan carboxypeptidase